MKLPTVPPLLALLPAGHPMLRTKATNAEVNDATRGLVRQMFYLMGQMPDALGLAAPQVGYSWRIFVMCAAENHENPKAFVNPEWHPYGMQEDFLEGCLSIPGEFRNIRRPYNGTLTWDNLDSGTRYAAEFVGLEARIIGHEMDHLDGVLITDHEDRE